MKKTLSIIALMASSLVLSAQELKEEERPSGWTAIPLPVFSYNTDLGFQFGATTDIYDYGKDPALYPEYRHKFHAQVSQYTKGQTLVYIEYDSSHLIPDIRFSASATTQIDPLYNFYGFGGDVTTYDRACDRSNGFAFYNYKRSMIRVMANFQGQVRDNLSWAAGLSFWHYIHEDLDFGNYDPEYTLYHQYREYGLIRDDETRGSVLEIKGGLSFDSRDFEPSPTKGIWAEAYAIASPGLFGTDAYLKLSAHFRHYFTPFAKADWLTFAWHLAWQGKIAGNVPFYMQQNISTLLFKQAYSEGLGGLNTVRGLLNARLVGNGYAWANFEARCRVFTWTLMGIEWYGAVNPFFDMGLITEPFRAEEQAEALGKSVEEIRKEATRLHKSAGIGLKLGLDRNYILSIEFAKPFSENDGPFAIMTSINYIF